MDFWPLPLQVVAITVFCLLVVAFYAFFAPFLGGHIWEYALFAAYTPVVCEFIIFDCFKQIVNSDLDKGLNKRSELLGQSTC